MRLVLVAAFAVVVGCGDDVPTSAPPDLSVPATAHDLAVSLGCDGYGHSQRCAPVGLVCSFATDASPYRRCFCDPWNGGSWRCGDCRIFTADTRPPGPGLPITFPNCLPVDDGCTQSIGEFFYTCRCMPDGSGRCCAADSAAGQAACFAVDGGA